MNCGIDDPRGSQPAATEPAIDWRTEAEAAGRAAYEAAVAEPAPTAERLPWWTRVREVQAGGNER